MKEVKMRVITVKFGRRTISLLWFATQLTRAIQEVQFCSKIKISKKKAMTASSTLYISPGNMIVIGKFSYFLHCEDHEFCRRSIDCSLFDCFPGEAELRK